MNNEEFQIWRDNPVTQEVLEYLKDKSTEDGLTLFAKATKGNLISPEDQIKIWAQAEVIRELEFLSAEIIEEFNQSDFNPEEIFKED